jgi:hypothetical protein
MGLGTRLKIGLSDQGPTTAVTGAEVPLTDVIRHRANCRDRSPSTGRKHAFVTP